MPLLNDSLSTFLSETRHSKFENMLSMSRKMTKRTTETGFLTPASMMAHFYKFRFGSYRNRFIYDVLPLAFYQSKLSGKIPCFSIDPSPTKTSDSWLLSWSEQLGRLSQDLISVFSSHHSDPASI